MKDLMKDLMAFSGRPPMMRLTLPSSLYEQREDGRIQLVMSYPIVVAFGQALLDSCETIKTNLENHAED